MLVAVLQSVARGTNVWRLIDRDEMTDPARSGKIAQGIHVLSRRELENYLYSPEVLSTFCRLSNNEEKTDQILAKLEQLLKGNQPEYADFRSITRELFDYIRDTTRIANLGNDRKEFALGHLVPALRETPATLEELERDIFEN